MADLKVRLYNVLFGDAILIIVPDHEGDKPRTRHILIDVGNALNKEGGGDFVFREIVEDIRETLNGAPIDLYIMTHEHMDHIQGLAFAEEKEGLPRLPVATAWLTASAEPGYYDKWKDLEMKKRPRSHLEQLKTLDAFISASKRAGNSLPRFAEVMMLNNLNTRKSVDCVAYLRQLATGQTHYIHRGLGKARIKQMHPLQKAVLEVWAPEENTAIYYGRFRPLTLDMESESDAQDGKRTTPQLTTPHPPPGVDAGAFYRLLHARRNGFMDTLKMIDRARNNSSIVFSLEWEGWRLLFPGDAELRSWKQMNKENQLKPVHFLKISHHLSHNGTPDDVLLDQLFPPEMDDGHERAAVASTYPGQYRGIPHKPTLVRLKNRGVNTYLVFEELFAGKPELNPRQAQGYIEFSFPAGGSEIAVARHIFPTE